MFQTSSTMQIDSPELFGLQGHRNWHSMVQLVPSCWVFISYFDTRLAGSKVIMTSNMYLLKEIASSSVYCVEEARLVSPPSMNGAQSWRFTELSKVILNFIKGSEALVAVQYEMADGTSFIERFQFDDGLYDGETSSCVIFLYDTIRRKVP